MRSSSSVSRHALRSLIQHASKQALAAQQDAGRSYVPRGAMADIWTSDATEFVLSGPAGTGKSRGALEYMHACALMYPRSRQLIVRKTRVSLTESGLVTFERYVLGEDNPICAGVQRANRSLYTYPNGSEIVVGGIDRPARIMSTEFDQIYTQEAVELSMTDYESLLTRLRNGVMPFQRLIGDCNPDRPDHWLKQRADAGRCVMRATRHEDNPVLFDEAGNITERGAAYLAKLDSLTGVRYLRLRLGLWVQAEGAVYEEWDEAIHLLDHFEPPASWRRIRAIDFGYTNPFVCLWIAIDPDGRMYVYRELYMTGRIVADHAGVIRQMSEGERFEATVADHDAEDRATLAAGGIPTVAAYKPIRVGIEAVQARLRAAGDGKPRLFVMRDALIQRDQELAEAGKPTDLVGEFGGYVWADGQDGKKRKEEPVDLDNHALDALRYAVMYVDRAQVRTRKNTIYE